jgi:glycoprotein-N-acetylgalactosamine 3-beta-galactosyltransferase
VILDNLRLLLSYFKSREPVYLGQNFKYFTRQGYHSGGAGYVISKNALDKLLNGINTGNCPIDGNDEDVDIGRRFSAFEI